MICRENLILPIAIGPFCSLSWRISALIIPTQDETSKNSPHTAFVSCILFYTFLHYCITRHLYLRTYWNIQNYHLVRIIWLHKNAAFHLNQKNEKGKLTSIRTRPPPSQFFFFHPPIQFTIYVSIFIAWDPHVYYSVLQHVTVTYTSMFVFLLDIYYLSWCRFMIYAIICSL